MLVARVAYFRAEKRGFAPGGELQDRVEAGTEVPRLSGGAWPCDQRDLTYRKGNQYMKRSILIAALAALTLVGCSKEAPPPPPADSNEGT